jgi:hypothetical protein
MTMHCVIFTPEHGYLILMSSLFEYTVYYNECIVLFNGSYQECIEYREGLLADYEDVMVD